MGEARHRTVTSRWPIRPRAVAALAVAVVGLAAAIYLPGRNDVADASERRSSFADDFGGERLDAAKWLIDGDPWENGRQRDGELVVDRLISTRKAFAQPFGHAEARIKVDREAGPWRAFGVVDKYGRVLRGSIDVLDKDADPTSGDDFHTYVIDWSPTAIVWSVDGRPALRLVPDEPGLPIALVLNLATDGRRPGRMAVDFVKVTASAKPLPTPSVPSSSPTSAAPTSPAPTSPAPTSPAPTSAAPTSPAPTSPAPTSSAPSAPAWKSFTDYVAGDLVTYKGVTYRVKEAHTSLPGWEPTALPALFEKV
ncbi:carbohydrate-binding protein [Actinoplanes sp. NPDC048796]|uniref:carbohydrate-binding protein n=1 Tax=unclassified Actinoplanes TaxID=2626549 RepID=UPI0033F9B3CB